MSSEAHPVETFRIQINNTETDVDSLIPGQSCSPFGLQIYCGDSVLGIRKIRDTIIIHLLPLFNSKFIQTDRCVALKRRKKIFNALFPNYMLNSI